MLRLRQTEELLASPPLAAEPSLAVVTPPPQSPVSGIDSSAGPPCLLTSSPPIVSGVRHMSKNGRIMWVHLQTSICTAWEQSSMVLSPGGEGPTAAVRIQDQPNARRNNTRAQKGISSILEALHRGPPSSCNNPVSSSEQKKPKTVHCCILQLHPVSRNESSAPKLECHVCKDVYASYEKYYKHLIDTTCAKRKEIKATPSSPAVVQIVEVQQQQKVLPPVAPVIGMKRPRGRPPSSSRVDQQGLRMVRRARTAVAPVQRVPTTQPTMVRSRPVMSTSIVPNRVVIEKVRNPSGLLAKRKTNPKIQTELLSLKIPPTAENPVFPFMSNPQSTTSSNGGYQSVSPGSSRGTTLSASSRGSFPSPRVPPSASSPWLLSPLQLPSPQYPPVPAYPTMLIPAIPSLTPVTESSSSPEDLQPLNLSIAPLTSPPALVPLRKESSDSSIGEQTELDVVGFESADEAKLPTPPPSSGLGTPSEVSPTSSTVSSSATLTATSPVRVEDDDDENMEMAKEVEAEVSSCPRLEGATKAISLIEHAADQARLAGLKEQLTQLLVSILGEVRLTEMGYPAKDILEILRAVLETARSPVEEESPDCGPFCACAAVSSATPQLVFRGLRRQMSVAEKNVRALLQICVPDEATWRTHGWHEKDKALERILKDAMELEMQDAEKKKKKRRKESE